MEVSFSLMLLYNTGFLQQVGLDVPTLWVKLQIETDIHVLSLWVYVIDWTAGSLELHFLSQ